MGREADECVVLFCVVGHGVYCDVLCVLREEGGERGVKVFGDGFTVAGLAAVQHENWE